MTRTVLPALAALSLAALAAGCADPDRPAPVDPGGGTPTEPPTNPPPSPPPAVDTLAPRVQIVDLPADDTLHRRGLSLTVDVRARGALRSLTLLVDSVALPQHVAPDTVRARRIFLDTTLAPGRHAFVVRAVDDSARVGTATFARVVRVDDVPYTVAPLPGLGGPTTVVAVNARGDAAGTAMNAAGVARAVRWRDGAVRELPSPATLSTVATGIDDAGDVIGQNAEYFNPLPGSRNAGWDTGFGRSPRVWRADGSVLELGPYTRPPIDSAHGPRTCCVEAGPLSSNGLAVAATGAFFVGDIVVVDLATDRFSQIGGGGIAVPSAINALGQLAGSVPNGHFSSFVQWTLPGAPVPVLRGPPGPAPWLCNSPCSPLTFGGLGDGGEMLVNVYYTPALTLADGTSFYLRDYLGPDVTLASLSRAGALVAGVSPTAGPFLLRGADRRVTRIALAGGPWVVEAIRPPNAAGTIPAQVRNTVTGWSGAALLVPAVP